MHLDYIELSQLVISRANMRARHKKDFADLVPSVRARGVLVPILVRPNDAPGIYEIVAGRRRFLAAKAVAEGEGGATAMPCAIMDPGDDVGALEASLLENIARLEADEVTLWETFARLVKQGRTVEDIATTFGLTQQAVRRVLALGNLSPRIRALYQREEVDESSVRLLTMATSAQQRDWLALYDSSDEYAPTGRMLKEWLFGGLAIRTSVALFDLAEYTAPIVADLFDEHSYFSNSALFWTLQNRAIEAKRDAYRQAGWADVVVLEPGVWFERWAYDKRTLAKGGRVYVAVAQHGSVEIHEGFLPRKEAVRLDKPATDTPRVRSELTAPLRRYVELHRHAVVRAHLLDRPWLALRMLLAHAICGSPLWHVQPERQRADKSATEASIIASRAQGIFAERRSAILAQLSLGADRTTLAGLTVPFAAMFDALARLSNDDVLAVASIVMGETLEAGSIVVDMLGEHLAPDISAMWRADEALFDLLRDRTLLGAMLEEVAGRDVAIAHADTPGKVRKAILVDCVEGRNGRTEAEGWVPRWLRFPATAYLPSDNMADDNKAVDATDELPSADESSIACEHRD